MSSFESPSPSTPLIETSQSWVEGRFVDSQRDSITTQLQDGYMAGVELFTAHRNLVRERIVEAGGIKATSSVAYGGYGNFLELINGEHIWLADVLQSEPLKVEIGELDTVVVDGQEAHRTYTLNMSFGGPQISEQSSSANACDLNSGKIYSEDGPFKVLLEDEIFFPENIGITETVTTEFGEEKFVDAFHFAIRGRIWRPTLRTEQVDAPNPHTNPAEYRLWAIQSGFAKMDLSFFGPGKFTDSSGVERIHYAELIDSLGGVKGNKLESYRTLGRLTNLLAYYGSRVFPDTNSAIEPTSRLQLPVTDS